MNVAPHKRMFIEVFQALVLWYEILCKNYDEMNFDYNGVWHKMGTEERPWLSSIILSTFVMIVALKSFVIFLGWSLGMVVGLFSALSWWGLSTVVKIQVE